MSKLKTIVSYDTPAVKVMFKNIKIDVAKCSFTLTLGIKQPSQRAYREEVVEGKLTSELRAWFTKMGDLKVPVKDDESGDIIWVKTGEKATPFQKYLIRKGVPTESGILSRLVFESDNISESYKENPFRLTRLKDRNILTLVNIPSKQRVEFSNPETGEVTVQYKVKFGVINGKRVKAFIMPTKYRRLIVQSTKEVKIATV